MNHLQKLAFGIVCFAWSLPGVAQTTGQPPKPETVQTFTLRNAAGGEARITNFGGILMSLKVPDQHGHVDDIVLGFERAEAYFAPAYVEHLPHFGGLIGRYANRIAKGHITLDGVGYQLVTNNGPNTLHGGKPGFDQHVWQAHEVGGSTLELTYESPDGEEGFPGKVVAKAVYTLTDRALKLEFTANTDQPTVVNLTGHTYFNLKGAGHGDVLDHVMQIEADAYTPTDAASIPLPGAATPVAGTPFDFTTPVKIGARIDADDTQLKYGSGYDHNYVLRGYTPGGTPRRIATVTEPTTGRTLTILSDQPGVQFYSGNQLDGSIVGKDGKAYHRRDAFCLEPQFFPDSPNRPDFPSTVLRPGETYHQIIVYEFGAAK